MSVPVLPDAATTDRDLSYWPTPDEMADDLVYSVLAPCHLPDGDGVRVLEPSAGDGALCRAVRARLPRAHLTAVEPDAGRAALVRAATATEMPIYPVEARAAQLPGVPLADEVVESTLEDYLARVAFEAMTGEFTPFDLVVANPPFTLPGRPEAWAEHLLAIAADPYLLAPGAVISAVVPHIALTGKSAKVRAVRASVEQCGGMKRWIGVSFSAAVTTALLWMQVGS